MLNFRTQFDKQEPISCCSGSPIVITYAPLYDDKGAWHLEETGKYNLYNEIQSHKDSCDINLLVARYCAGETDVLSRVNGIYADLTEMPTSYAEVLNKVSRAQTAFDALPVEVKEKYGNSFESFLADFGSDSWCRNLGFVSEEKEEVKETVEDA